MGDKTKLYGLHEKFIVTRTDGSSEPGGKHEECSYFVLDLDHDPHAIPALAAYAESCEASHPMLARDLRAIIAGHDPKWLMQEGDRLRRDLVRVGSDERR